MESDERRKVSLMQALATIRNEKVAIRKESAQRRKQVSGAGQHVLLSCCCSCCWWLCGCCSLYVARSHN